MSAFDVSQIRKDFPILEQTVRGRPLVYLDSAATSQKPRSVIEAVRRYYEEDNSNIHRGVHLLSERATEKYEEARKKVQSFLNAADTREIVFVRGATEGINLVAQSFARPRLKAGDEILISGMEHHSNIVPWQLVCEATGAKLKVIPFSDAGEIFVDDYKALLSTKTKLVAIVHISNALGTVNPVKEMIAEAHARGVPVLVDAAQSVPHTAVDVKDLDCDFLVFSGHKLFGPTGIGVLYGKSSWLEAMPPYQGGGDMIRTVSFERTTYNDLPYKFEAGTPNIEGVIGLGAAIDYVRALGLENIAAYEKNLLDYATQKLLQVPGLQIIGNARHKASVVSFILGRPSVELGSRTDAGGSGGPRSALPLEVDIHPHDIGTILDQEGIAIRTGHHCAMPVMERYGISATARASLAFYNTKEEIDVLIEGLGKVRKIFS